MSSWHINVDFQSRNLIGFWTVQEASGLDSVIFDTEGKAFAQRRLWTMEANRKDLIEPWYPGGVYYHPPYSESLERWCKNKGNESIPWGNPATSRFGRG